MRFSSFRFIENICSLARLDPALDGLTITHLSDLHLTGRMSKDFYR